MTPIIGTIASSFQGATAPASYESIASYLITSNTVNVTFSNIPQTYNHLQLRLISRDTRGLDNSPVELTFNGDTNLNYYRHGMYGASSTITTETTLDTSSIWFMGGGSTGATKTFGSAIVDILDYKNTNKKKTTLAYGGQDYNGSGWAWVWSGHWNQTSAITSIRVASYTNGTFNFLPGSRFALYGIKVAS